ncbi:peptide ABC transporter substrate-binding protein [uncultured Sphaerochaeta sp.]|uniref:peptide ABC transporter substrate-binding protein n=1 Tax=uncultured Sphaerochaeta sp. TaxID=886478 RepID=UPI002A0A5986|nr:peptide ABC transporter substrate-binding protein [uncultured Sphaerochaeta sp.]
MYKKNVTRTFLSAFGIVCLCLTISMMMGCSGKAETNANGTVASETVAEKQSDPKTEEKIITLAMVSSWDSIIPFDTTSAYSDVLLDLMFEKMFFLKANGTYTPRLAERYEMNSDSTILTFYLNKNAKWTDGVPLTAKDVVFTANLYASPSLNALRKNNLAPFVGFGEGDGTLKVIAVDDYTVEFYLKEPTNADYLLFNKFRDFYILPEHILGQVPVAEIRSADYWKSPIGAGSCIYKSQISGERVEFVANKNYYLKTPQWDKFVVRVVPTGNLLAGLMNGEIDALAGNVASLQLSDWSMAKQQSNLVCTSVPSLGYQYMAINYSKAYLTPEIHRIINMAIDRKLIVDGLLRGEGVVAFSPVAPDNIYYNKDVEEPYNPEKAKALLASSGWDPNRVLVMSVPTGNTIREQAAVIIQQNLASIGIKAVIETADFPTHLNRVRKGDYDLGFIGSGGSPDPSECVINFNPDHMNNFSQLSDWTIYNAGEKGGHAFDYTERKQYYDEYQNLLREYVPFAFLYFQNNLFANTTNVHNIVDVQDYSQMNRDVWNWTID